MKVKIVLGVVAAIVIVFVGSIIIEYARTIVLGNMGSIIEGDKTANTEIDFTACEGEAVKVSVKTQVKNGEIKYIVSDSKGNIIDDLGTADAMEVFVDIPYDDTYTLSAIYKEFSGEYNVKVTQRRF